MKLIKLSAIDSTNSFLKDLAVNNPIEDYTIVVTEHQTKGRGQMKNSWESEAFKNLTFSIFTRIKHLKTHDQPYLNFAISLAVFEVLNTLSVPNLSIKWPNDIMAGNRKICGLLIETTFKNIEIKNTIIGIGLNVNQEKFSKNSGRPTSLKLELNLEFDLNTLMLDIIETVKKYIDLLENHQFEFIYNSYTHSLYKRGKPMAFFDHINKVHFMGMIIDVSTQGKLRILLEDDSIKEFDNKEVTYTITSEC